MAVESEFQAAGPRQRSYVIHILTADSAEFSGHGVVSICQVLLHFRTVTVDLTEKKGQTCTLFKY